MFRFFSNFRYQLAAENRLPKYLRYAFGEIMLVVIGILIALQVNNVNEKRKEAVFEHKVLHEIQVGIQQNIAYLNRGIRQNERAINSCRILLDHFEQNLPYNDSLDRYFSFSLQRFYPSLDNNAYEGLKTYGMHLIRNDSIRDMLGRIYEWKYIEILNQRQEEYFFGTIAPLLTDWFESYQVGGTMKPYNYYALKESKKYKHILRTLISNLELQNQLWKDIKGNRMKLYEMIKKELNKE